MDMINNVLDNMIYFLIFFCLIFLLLSVQIKEMHPTNFGGNMGVANAFLLYLLYILAYQILSCR